MIKSLFGIYYTCSMIDSVWEKKCLKGHFYRNVIWNQYNNEKQKQKKGMLVIMQGNTQTHHSDLLQTLTT